jgi:GPH family glycoside/pentoside/hexuronide:cation symporter
MNKRAKHVVSEKDKVPLFEKLMYGAGSGSFQMAIDGVNQLANPIFNITLGLPPSAVGLVGMISRISDAFTDPLMGSISDNTRTRFGRRRPYILIGAVLTAFAFTLIWRVPESWGVSNTFVWYLCAMLLFYLCSTIQNVPYHTLGLEMTADHHERTVVSSFKMLFGYLFTAGVPWIFRIAQSETLFDSVMDGIRHISWFVALGIMIGGVLPALFVKERYQKIASKAKKVPFRQGAAMTLKNKPFRILIGIILCTGISGGMVGPMGFYIANYHVYGGDLKAGSQLFAIGSNVWMVCSIVSLVIMTKLCQRIGKTNTLRIVVILGIIAALSSFVLYNKHYPYLLLVFQALVAPVGAGFWTITTSMKADVCDDDELKSGARREGMFGSIGNWIMKMAGACTLFISGLILQFTGFDAELGGDQIPGAVLNMRLCFALIPAITGCIAMYLLHIYPLGEDRMDEIRAELETRRGAVE